jgi:hypothetical protein
MFELVFSLKSIVALIVFTMAKPLAIYGKLLYNFKGSA